MPVYIHSPVVARKNVSLAHIVDFIVVCQARVPTHILLSCAFFLFFHTPSHSQAANVEVSEKLGETLQARVDRDKTAAEEQGIEMKGQEQQAVTEGGGEEEKEKEKETEKEKDIDVPFPKEIADELERIEGLSSGGKIQVGFGSQLMILH